MTALSMVVNPPLFIHSEGSRTKSRRPFWLHSLTSRVRPSASVSLTPSGQCVNPIAPVELRIAM